MAACEARGVGRGVRREAVTGLTHPVARESKKERRRKRRRMNKAAGLSGQTAGSVREMGRYVLGVISLAVSGLRGAARQVGGRWTRDKMCQEARW